MQALQDGERRDAARRLTAPLALEMARASTRRRHQPDQICLRWRSSQRAACARERALAQQIEWLKAIEMRQPYSDNAILAPEEPAAIIAEAQKLGFAARVLHPLGDIISVPEKEIATLNYLLTTCCTRLRFPRSSPA